MTNFPPLHGEVYLTDGGIETDLVFHGGFTLPEFASFVLLEDSRGVDALEAYFREYLRIGSAYGRGLVLETPTWRASADWGALLGYDAPGLRNVNHRAVQLLLDLRDRNADSPVVVSGCLGPRGDAYADLGSMTEAEAERYHRAQVEVLAGSGVDVVTALTITNVAEAIGIVRAAELFGLSVVISFTVETDGALPTGTSLADAIDAVDEATDSAAAYFMINCAHTDHFAAVLDAGTSALGRIGGVRANASRLSHAELDESETLDDGDPAEFGTSLASLHERCPNLHVLGGCCGTDHRHIEQIAARLPLA